MLLVEKGNDLCDPGISSASEVISEDMETPDIFNDFFVNIVPSLKILPEENYQIDVNKFKTHPIIKVIKYRKTDKQRFTFNYVFYEEALNEIRKLETVTTTQQKVIPTKGLKETQRRLLDIFIKT